jgi:hypothetical protein
MKTSEGVRWGSYPGPGVLLVLTTVFLTACASARGIENFYLNPADGDMAAFTHEGLTVSSRYLDVNDRVQYLRASGREALARETRELPLSTFLLKIVNAGDAEVIVDPAGIRLLTGFGPMMSTVSYAHLYMALPGKEGRQVVLQELQGVALDRPVTVPPGGRKEGLLFFQRPRTVAKDVAVVLGGLYKGGALLDGVLAFEAVPLEE